MMGVAMPKIPEIKRIAAAALPTIDAILMHWLPGGRHEGKEYLVRNPRRGDHSVGSFSVNTTSGHWGDFATGDRGLDMVSLVAFLENETQGEACQRLAAFLGIELEKKPTPKRAAINSNVPSNGKPLTDGKEIHSTPISPGLDGDGWQCVMPIPENAPKPPPAHLKHGVPTRRYSYFAEDGQVNFFQWRFEPKKPDQRKQFSPVSLWQKGNKLEWRFKAPPEPRPLYGLPSLLRYPDAEEVWFCEGEKSCEALEKLLINTPVMTWAGGSQAVLKSDYSPLAGRHCAIWPDFDDAGRMAASKLRQALLDAGALSVQVLDISKLERAPGQPLQPGDDAADLVVHGWDARKFSEFLKRSGAFLPVADPVPMESKPVPKSEESGVEQQRNFELSDGGLFFIEQSRDGRFRRRRISDAIEILARTRTPDNKDWGLLVKFRDPDGRIKKVILRMRDFNGDAMQVTGVLLGEGLHIEPQGRKHLIEFLQTAQVKKHARVSERCGWHGEADEMIYLFHDDYLGASSEEWLCSNPPEEPIFKQRGSLSQWQEKVSGLCAGNSRLVFAVSAAFGSALIHLVNGENIGIHFRGGSSSGKTTALCVASSVAGGADYMLQWRGTDNSLETIASQHTDTVLVLDELKQLDPKVVNEVCYMLGNGTGKNRNKADGGNRKLIKWRTLLLSSGEISLQQHANEAGKRVHTGAEIRLSDVGADAGAGMGAFENIHGYELPSKFAETLNANAARYYGVAFVEFIKHLITAREEVIPMLKECEAAFTKATLTEQASGQARRVASRFSLIAAGGELATRMGITGWVPGEAMRASIVCFEAWLKTFGGQGNKEERAMIEQVQSFLAAHGESRFSDRARCVLDENHSPKTLVRVGFREGGGIDPVQYYVYPTAFRDEVCKGHDYRSIAKLLVDRGYMKAGEGRNLAPKIRGLPGHSDPVRMYHITHKIWEYEND